MTDFVTAAQAELSNTPTPMLYGPSEVVDGWCSLEQSQRATALEVLRGYTSEVALWYRGLGLMLHAFPGDWNIPDGEPDRQATILRINLLGLEVSSAKAALDMTLAGYYSIAMASIRHMLEATAQMVYLSLFPDSHVNWDPEAENPGMRRMCDQIKSELRRRGARLYGEDRFDALYNSWKLMCKGSHPSGAGLTQVMAQEGEERNIVGSVYRPEFIDVIFDHGLWAILMNLIAFPDLKTMDQEWVARFQAWTDDRQVWRQEFRERLGLVSDVGDGAVTSVDLEI